MASAVAMARVMDAAIIWAGVAVMGRDTVRATAPHGNR